LNSLRPLSFASSPKNVRKVVPGLRLSKSYISERCDEVVGGGESVSEGRVVSWFQVLLSSSSISVVTKQYALLSLAKLSTRFNSVIQEEINNK